MPSAYFEVVETPAGALAFAVNADGALLCSQFVHGLYRVAIEQELADDGYTVTGDAARTALVAAQLREYTSGERRVFELPLAPAGSAWQQRVWLALTHIPFGETRSYGELAAELDAPRSARAVGRANATNPLPLIVPCHRLIGADGSLTGFGGGLDLKARLLAHERQFSHTVPTVSAR